jgi:hypothetical protein
MLLKAQYIELIVHKDGKNFLLLPAIALRMALHYFYQRRKVKNYKLVLLCRWQFR